MLVLPTFLLYLLHVYLYTMSINIYIYVIIAKLTHSLVDYNKCSVIIAPCGFTLPLHLCIIILIIPIVVPPTLGVTWFSNCTSWHT